MASLPNFSSHSMKLFSSDQINASYQKNQVLYISDKHIFTIILTIDLLTSIIIIYHSGWKKRIPFKILPKKWCYFDKWNKRLLRKKGGTFKTSPLCTMLQKLSKCEVKAARRGNLIICLPLRFYSWIRSLYLSLNLSLTWFRLRLRLRLRQS